MKKLIQMACACFIWTLSSQTLRAEPITLTFDETPPGLVSVTNPAAQPPASPFLSFRGVTFEFRVNNLLSADARYGAAGPGTFTFVQGRVLEGDAAGILTLNFTTPTSLLSFGVALTSANNLTPGLTVELFDTALRSVGITAVDTSHLSALPLSEGSFSYTGVPISRAVLNFNEGALAFPLRRFAMDNLTIEPIPEPTTMMLLGTGLAGVAVRVRRRRRGIRSSKE
jgi:hypothetical protein